MKVILGKNAESLFGSGQGMGTGWNRNTHSGPVRAGCKLRTSCLRGGNLRFGLISFIVLIILGGCQSKKAQNQVQDFHSLDTTFLSVSYAKGFRFEKGEAGTILILSDPVKPGKEIARYRFLQTKSGIEPMDGYVDIVAPVKRMAASSTTHAGFLSAIGAGDQLMGCNNPERLFDTLLFNRFLTGKLLRTGRDLEYNLEFLIASKPDLVLQTGIDGQFNSDARLTAVDIPVMFILEWMESTPLGRAEWVKVFGLMTGKTRVADSLFQLVEKSYLACARLGSKAPEKIRVLTGNVFKGTWYMPGGGNYMTRYFEDAGMDYLYRNTSQSASLALSFESVVYQLADAPVWINVNVDSVKQLRAAEPRYSVFKALQEHRVFSLFNRVNSHGGNDFWESAVVRPDLVLADLLAIAHPELILNPIWNYYKPLVFNE